ncbi:MAG: hypothetical protein ABI446_06695 [Gemmatimonadaceae bacterium]
MTKPVSPFADKPYAIDLVDDAVLAGFLKKNVNNLIKYAKNGATIPTPAKQVPFSMILMSKDGHHKYAGVDDDAICYAASLLKVGVMYAAYEYLAAANRFLQETPRAEAAFMTDFDTAMQAAVKKATPARLRGKPISPSSKPAQILQFVAGAHPFLEFTDAFFKNIDEMIVPSSDTDAMAVIDALGYSYINTALRAAGLSEIAKRTKRNIVWISGDYSIVTSHFVVLFNTINDGYAKLAMNTRGMARLGALLQLDVMIDRVATTAIAGIDRANPNRVAMQKHLLDASIRHPGRTFDQPFTTRNKTTLPFKILQNKLGLGPIGPDPLVSGKPPNPQRDVASELTILTYTGDTSDPDDVDGTNILLAKKGLTGTVVVCWQNYRDFFIGGSYHSFSYEPVSDIVINTIESYLTF